MSVRVMTAVFDHSDSRLADRLILLVIADRADDDGTGCYRGKESIARMARVSRSTVTEAITRLTEMGELEVEHRPGRTSLYRVVLPGVGQNPAGSGRPESGRGSATRPADRRPGSGPDPSLDTSTSKGEPSQKRTGDPIEDRRRAQAQLDAENERRENEYARTEKAPMPGSLRDILRNPPLKEPEPVTAEAWDEREDLA